ncbi:MAG: hypothetical protein Q8880_06625 [Bacteroidota bacterium]|nr:hypothetical protein [Bacteroidota bacterium]
MLNKILRYFGFFMVFVYLGAGFLIIFTKSLVEWLSLWQRIAIGILMIIYGIFRAYRVIVTRDDE